MKKPDIIVWDENKGYNSKNLSFPTNVGSQYFSLPNVPVFRNESSKKMIDTFNQEIDEIKNRLEKIYDEYNTSIMIWESKISFEPIVGNSYFLYNFAGQLTLSLISPDEWNRKNDFVGEYILTSDRKWITKEKKS